MRNIKFSFEKYYKTSGMKLARNKKKIVLKSKLFCLSTTYDKEKAISPMKTKIIRVSFT